ncbi:MAG: flagellum-specific ATP synthase FliI, partial [Sulfitobacter sp.]|nr:flagellum-specific ATP synthase FliI [Sulfitobacter sp.]
MSTFSKMQKAIYSSSSTRIIGATKAIVGLTLTVRGLEAVAGIGSRCRVFGRTGVVDGEVVGADGSDLCVLPFGTWEGIAVGDPVELIEMDDMIYPDDSWIGSVV